MNKDIEIIKRNIPNIPDFPVPGVQFKDVTPLIRDPKALRATLDELNKLASKYKYDYIVAPESRGFWFGVPLALENKKFFIPVRKKGKLPRPTIATEDKTEYSNITLEIHKEDIPAGAKALIVDDLLATGGTVRAIIKMLNDIKVKTVAAIFIIDLPELDGKTEIEKMGVQVEAILQLPGK
ncbi:MAG: adenine phosphoribosyltransferase [Mycoplasmataceae bacterium]|nr:adenine phosphoribosyltransferase [Mycoplasmataceae bacterium]